VRYTGVQTITLYDTTPNATIYYTTNGTTPSTSSAVYSAGSQISVGSNETIDAIAVASGYTNSAVASAAYVINLPVAATPTFSEGGGTYTGMQSITLYDATPGATIYYTTNGTTPTTSSSVYSASNPIKVGSNETIEAIAVASGYTNSAVASAAYVINLPVAATPTFSEGGGTYTGVQSITLYDATPGATIYYTTNGTTPSASSTVYSAGTSISVSTSETIKAMAVAPAYAGSAVTSAAYQITVAASLIPNGTYSIVNRNSGQAIEVPGWSGAQGTALDQWSVNGGANQKWQLTNLGNNLVELVNVNSGLAAEVSGSSTADGAQIDQRQYVDTANQIWSVVSVGGGYYELVNQNSGLALEVPGWSGTQGTLLDQWNANGGANQVWSIQ
jgi:LysM repeat protein